MPSDLPDYELLDFGNGRKLERFGPWILDRPAPAADVKPKRPGLWSSATARYDGDRATEGKWSPAAKGWREPYVDLTVSFPKDTSLEDRGGGLPRFILRVEPLPSGQVGVFPEQLASWQWIAKQVVRRSGPPLRVLNLFAYSGASTLAAAAVGAEVTHVDAAKSMVGRARENAKLSGLAEAPIRWIVEDAHKFCQREVKRDKTYDAVILDPPTYGHGPKGEEWRINRDLLPLLELCGALTARSRAFVLATCHTPGFGTAELSAYLADGLFGHCGQPPQSGTLALTTTDDRNLPSGTYARWP